MGRVYTQVNTLWLLEITGKKIFLQLYQTSPWVNLNIMLLPPENNHHRAYKGTRGGESKRSSFRAESYCKSDYGSFSECQERVLAAEPLARDSWCWWSFNCNQLQSLVVSTNFRIFSLAIFKTWSLYAPKIITIILIEISRFQLD